MKNQKRIENVGIVWYTPEEWERMKQISIDSERLEDSFKEWESMAQKTLNDMKATGIAGTKVFIKAEEFFVWCKIHSLPVDAASRSRYVSELMSKRNGN
jgi:ribosomal protein S16